MAYFVYILECENKALYTGITTDLERRFSEHQVGKGGRYTRSNRPTKILYNEVHDSRSKATMREIEIKKLPRSKKIALINSDKEAILCSKSILGKRRRKMAKKKRKPNAAFMKPLKPSAALAEVVGAKPLPRTQVVKKLWAYIKKKKLQNPKNKREIMADAKLKPLFGGKKKVDMFQMTKLVSKHLN